MIVTCPSCSTRFKYSNERFAGVPSKHFQCTVCNKIFEVVNPSFTDNILKENEKNAAHAPNFSAPKPPLRLPQAGYGIRLVFLTGPNSSTTLELTNFRTIIGRDEGDIVTMDPETSKRHAMIEIMDDGTVWLSDLGSTNGTVTNGAPITVKSRLADRQEFSCGKSAFMLMIDEN
jgi:hypothetical protein